MEKPPICLAAEPPLLLLIVLLLVSFPALPHSAPAGILPSSPRRGRPLRLQPRVAAAAPLSVDVVRTVVLEDAVVDRQRPADVVDATADAAVGDGAAGAG